MTDFTIRDARDDERATIRQVTVSAYEQYASQMPEHWAPYRRDILNTESRPRPAQQIVAEKEGKIVGSVLLYPAGMIVTSSGGDSFTRRWPEVRLLAVLPEARGHGIGRALMEECIRRAREAGAEALTLHTTDLMQTAMRLYERMGFQRVPELDYHPVEGVTVKGYRFDL
jgi:GNAT superfamily N-acetyltransferase